MGLNGVLRFQAVAYAAFGVVLFLVPDFYSGLFGWDGADSVLGRLIGGAFLGLAWIEWKVADTADASMAWPFAAVPALFVVGFLWENAAGTYDGTGAWLWTNLLISASFALVVGGAAIMARD